MKHAAAGLQFAGAACGVAGVLLLAGAGWALIAGAVALLTFGVAMERDA